MKKIFATLFFMISTLNYSQSENLVDITWICTNIVINSNTIQPPNDYEVEYVLLQMRQDNDPGTEDFATNVCDVLSSSDSIVTYNDTDITFTISQLTETLGGCPINQNFQSSYFGFFQNNVNIPLGYETTNINDIDYLTITAPNGDKANYQEFILSVKENQLADIDIYPNPATEIIHIDSSIDAIKKVEILSISGQIVKSINNPSSTIDISDITEGLYFLRMHSSKSFISKRFVKN